MKKIINGTRYDTDKATLIGYDTNGLPTNDFGYWWAGLYTTPRSGKFFLCGEGGPMSRYGTVSGDNRGSGERLEPMTKEEAMDWAEDHLDADIIEQYFGDMIKDA